jgi:hypothetical protein
MNGSNFAMLTFYWIKNINRMSSALLLILGIISLMIDIIVRNVLPFNKCLDSDIIFVNIFILEIMFIYSITVIIRRCNSLSYPLNTHDDDILNTCNVTYDDDDVMVFDTSTSNVEKLKHCFVIDDNMDESIDVSHLLQDIPLKVFNNNDNDRILLLPLQSQSRQDIWEKCCNLCCNSPRVNAIALQCASALCIYCIFHFIQDMNSIKTVMICTSFFILSINDYYQKRISSIRESHPSTPTVQLITSMFCLRIQDYTLYPVILILYGISLVIYGTELSNENKWVTLNLYNVTFNYIIPAFLPLGIKICTRTQSVKTLLENSLPFLSVICALSTIISWKYIECVISIVEYFIHFEILLTLLVLPILDIISISIILMICRSKNNLHAAVICIFVSITMHKYDHISAFDLTISNQTSFEVDKTTMAMGSSATLLIFMALSLSVIYDCIESDTVIVDSD